MLALPSGLGLPAEYWQEEAIRCAGRKKVFLNVARSYSISTNEMERFFKPTESTVCDAS
jgi:hypothetical protein